MCLVLYGSQSGNAADLADNLYDSLRRRPLANVEIKPFGKTSLDEIQQHRHVFIICSTTGQGALPANCQPCWSTLLRRGLRAPALSNVRLFSFGLGSSSYPRFNWATRKIHSRFIQLGAQEAVPRGEGDDMGAEAYESVFDQWMSMALSELDSELQIIDIKPPSELLPCVNPLKMVSTYTPPPSPPALTRSSNLLPASVVANDRITDPEHFQDVRNLKLSVETGGYSPGDVLCLYPANDDVIVDRFLKTQNWEDIADNHVIVPKSCEIDGGWCFPLTLRALLKWHLDLNTIPRRKFFVMAQHFCENSNQAERCQELAADLDDLFNYTTRPRRSIIETLEEFTSLRIPLEYLLDFLPSLRLRQFSIASGPQDANIVELSVSVVKYKTLLRKIRRGLCTHWIEQLKPGDQILVSLERSNLKLAERMAAKPQSILIATGTGIAPIRSLLHGVNKSQAQNIVLFFGCRYADKDFLYRDELIPLVDKLVPAFSREGGGYVQQQIVKHAQELDVQNAFIFLCGSAGSMPRAVREALVDCLAIKGLTKEAAEQVISSKEKNGEYYQETW